MLKLNIAGIPEELKKNKRWVGFEIGKNGKKPIDPKSIGGFITYASISDSSTWGTFEEALKLVEAGLCDGIGYAITKDDKFIFIDLDNHLDKLTSCTGTGYLRNAGKGGMGRESVGKPAISKGLSAVWAGIGAAAYHLS